MDGPAHLYNSNIIHNLIKGNPALHEFYTLNPLLVPNWISHFVLSVFRFVLPAWLAEKVLLILYVSGMAFSFRYLIKELSPANTYFSILVFPFIYSFLFHLGFYNFCISFSLFFFTIGYWLRIHSSERFRVYLPLFFFITLTYFSNVLTYVFLGITLGLYIIWLTWHKYRENHDISGAVRTGGRKLLYLLLVSLPSLVLLVIFYTNVNFFPSNQNYSVKELLKWIIDVRPLIVFNYSGEEIITRQFFYALLILLILGFIFKTDHGISDRKSFLRKADVMLIPLFISLLLLFIIPNGSGAGMMSDRFCLMNYVFLLIWTVSRAGSGIFSRYIIVIMMVLHFGLLLKHLNGTIRKLDDEAISIYQASYFIEENSIVLPINLSDNWLHPHFSNYLGVEKPLIILENYEAGVGWFPVKWRSGSMPDVMLGNSRSLDGLSWAGNSNSGLKRQIQYILLFGNKNKLNEPEWKELKKVLSSGFDLKYRSKDGKVLIYERSLK